jgi:hypothetical protein
MNLNYSLMGAKTHWIRSHDDKRSKLFSDEIRICCEVMTRRTRLVERKPFVGENFLLEGVLSSVDWTRRDEIC